MSPDFDKVIDRRNSDSIKWSKYGERDIIPMWVADTDFECPCEVIEALEARVDQRIFGYVRPKESCEQAVVEALFRDFRWAIGADQLVWLPTAGVGIHLVCRALLAQGEAAVIPTPIYPPFLEAPVFGERDWIKVPLKNNNSRWEWDFDLLESALADATRKPRLLYLCNPHNPVGRAWTRSELEQLLAIAVRHNLLVCSDEVHCDLILEPGIEHIPFASLSTQAAERTVTLMSPAKPYNLAGVSCGFAITSNADLKALIVKTMHGIVPHPTTLGYIACEAAYRYGMNYRAELLTYLKSNRDRVLEVLGPTRGITVFKPEATFLAWIDTQQIANAQLFFENAGVGLYDGGKFGTPGYVRLNFGCPRATLDEALQRMTRALDQIGKSK